MIVLRVQDIGKAFRRYRSEWHRFARWFGLPVKPAEEAWVLRHINFDVREGEAVGIIGQNGAGKSTLLKIITGTLQPTEGQVEVRGRIAAILELGMGFHPELTGRQNVRHAAGLMGFSREQIEAAMADIEAFAEIGEYFDQPVRTYSNGMQMRVAFAVATAWRPEILIVDEALSVGDAAFQRKCFRRIEDFRSHGTTLLFVSHSMETVKKICDRAVFLKNGEIAAIGTAKTVCDEYERFLFGGQQRKKSNMRVALFDQSLVSTCEMSYGNGAAIIENIWISDQHDNPINVIQAKNDFCVNYIVTFTEDVVSPVFAIMIKTKEGIAIYGTDTSLSECKDSGFFCAGERRKISFRLKNNLAPGIYYLNCGIRDDSGEKPIFLHRRVDALIFRVTPSSNTTVLSGLLELDGEIVIEELTA